MATEMAEVPTMTIEIAHDERRDTIRGVINPAPFVVGDSMLVGIVFRDSGDDRAFFRAIPARGAPTIHPILDDVGQTFTDVVISPNARASVYVAYDPKLHGVMVLRSWPYGALLARSGAIPDCSCDVDTHHARWVNADSFELVTQIDTLRWERISGSISARKLWVDTTRTGEPDWHQRP